MGGQVHQGLAYLAWLALIRKRYTAGLNTSKEDELRSLQDDAAKVFVPVDRRRLDHVKSLAQSDRPATDD